MQDTTQINNTLNLQQELANESSEIELLSNKLAEVTKEMNQFTYIVSHDLQAPLRMVTGFLELLEKKYGDKLDESAKQYIDFAVKGAGKMKKLIFDLLEYSRLSTVVKEYAEVDLNEIVQEVKVKFQTVIEETGTVVTTSHLPVIIADKAQMIQLFENLIGNALKFRNMEEPEISITLNKENDISSIAVKDNGVGFDSSFSEKIFIIFRRLYSDELKYSGTGIGLAICKKVAELHGGTVRAESEEGKGSIFYVTLPGL
jgi:light-regulated signal transduction histidine kinase (bacteriophytochrome)